jgi:hypothetical protein
VTFVSFSDANALASEFLALIEERGISPAMGGKLEDEFLSIAQLLEVVKNPEQAAGLANERSSGPPRAYMTSQQSSLAAHKTGEFSQFDEHIKLIATGNLKTTLSQIGGNDPIDDTARKLVELYVACLAVHCGADIRLDHPANSKGDNPDILLSYGDEIWALAIKTPSSQQGQTLFENIQKAGGQIERSSANRGLVVLNVKNIIDHEALWQGSFATLDDAMAALKAEIAKVCEAADRNRPVADWDAVFEGKKTVLPVLLIGQSVVLLPTSRSAKTPTSLKMMLACGFDRGLHQSGAELAGCLTHWMQIILRGDPGPPPN